jgi:DNA-binding CsgD family transcriptional regulator
MCKLTKNQIEVLELFYKGYSKKEIQKKAELSPSSVDEALRRGKINVDKAVETIRVAVERGLVSSSQIAQLKRICHKI